MSLKKLGRYDLIRVLGKGAMGLVYEGRDPNLDRRVAIKTIKVENLSDEAAAEYEVRFRTEARSAARLQHPNIVSVYDSDRDGDMAFLVMEFVEGDDLKHHLDKGGVYTLQQTLGIMTELLSALSYAHSQKIVHRDIKPANLLVQASGSIKLADFGVARIQDSGDATRTQGSIVGTLKYMSPEQLEGRPIDARADLFAAAVVLYQLLTSQRPFDGESDFAVIHKIVNHTPAAATFYNPKLPPAIDAVVAKALAKSRDMRYGTAQDFLAALLAACSDATDTTVAPQAVPPAKGSNSTWTATMMYGESLVTAGTNVTSGTSMSEVTQEVELVYWKDIKESSDIEDVQGFLVKFPSGIYADLARRRLRNLYAATSAEPTMVSPRALAPTAAVADKTWLPPQHSSAGTEAIFAAAPLAAAPLVNAPLVNAPLVNAPLAAAPLAADANRPTVQTASSQAVLPGSRHKTVWLVAGLAALAVAGMAFKLLPNPNPNTNPNTNPNPNTNTNTNPNASSGAAIELPASTSTLPTSTSTLPAQVVASAALPTLATAPAPQAAPAPRLNAPAARPAAASANNTGPAALPAASAAEPLTARKAAPNKEKPVKVDVAPPSEPSPKAPRSAPAAAAALPSAVVSPRTACEDRILLGFQSCVSEQCARPVFVQHPMCVERRGMEERRREAERNR